MKSIQLSFLALLCTLFLSIGSLSAQDIQPFSSMDVFDLQWVQNPQISPDGEHIVYERRGFDIMTDRRTSSLWLINSDGSNHRKLTGRMTGEGSPTWAPD